MMRVAYLTGQLSGQDGWSRLALETIRHVSNRGIDCTTLVAQRGAPSVEVSFQHYEVLPSWPQKVTRWTVANLRAFPRVWSKLQGADLVHCLMEPYLPLAAMGARLRGVPLVVSAVGTYAARTWDRFFRISPFAFWSRGASRVVCISRYTESRVSEHLGDAKTTVINPGVDNSFFSPGQPSGRAAAVTGRVVLSVGAVKPRKGLDVLLRAIALLGDHLREVSLYVVGSLDERPGYVRNIVSLAEELGVRDRLKLLGRISDQELLQWYRRADVSVLSAANREEAFEGYGLVLLEANACGSPVIGCYASGAEDIIVCGENGLLVPREDPKSLAEALVKLLGDRGLAKRMGESGLRHAAARSWENTAGELVDLYGRVLAESSGSERVEQPVPKEKY